MSTPDEGQTELFTIPYASYPHRFAHIAVDDVVELLKDFPIRLEEPRDARWLADAIRRTLPFAAPGRQESPDRPGNAETKDELNRLADLAQTTALALNDRSHEADWELFELALKEWKGNENRRYATRGPSFLFTRLNRAVNEIGLIAQYLGQTAAYIEAQPRNWRLTADRNIRINRGYVLAAIYEIGFGREATVNNWPNADDPTTFMEFYRLVVKISANDKSDCNLSAVLKQALRMHREHPLSIEDVIPET